MFVSEANFGAATLMLLYPNNLFGIDVDVFFVVVGYLHQNAHMILPVVNVLSLSTKRLSASGTNLLEKLQPVEAPIRHQPLQVQVLRLLIYCTLFIQGCSLRS